MPTTSFKIFRYQPDASAEPYYQDFSLEHDEELTLLDAVLRLQNEQDGTLAIRYSCRSAICGSCACRADGRTVLACMQQVEELKTLNGNGAVQVDPLGQFRPVKDLVVDMDPFWEKFKSVKPYLVPSGPAPERDDENWMKHTLAYLEDDEVRLDYSEVTVTKYEPQVRTY